MIRTEFTDAALLTIAHRLCVVWFLVLTHLPGLIHTSPRRTVIDFDRVLLLSSGNIIEDDTPSNLLSRDSAFRRMCQETGEFEELVRLAKEKK